MIAYRNKYYPYGSLFGESAAASLSNRRLFGGKELVRDMGFNCYDQEARCYDPVLGRFLSQDPLQSKYLSLSSYLYCAANPVMLSDPTGMKIEYKGSESDVNKLKALFETLCKDSYLFNHLYRAIDDFEDTYSVEYGCFDVDGESDNKKAHPARYNKSTKTMTLKSNISQNLLTYSIAEETYHMYQGVIKSPEGSNEEFEAKTCAFYISEQTEDIPNCSDFIDIGWNKQLYKYLDKKNIPQNITSESFLNDYEFYGLKFVKEYEDAPEYLKNYKNSNVSLPERLVNVLTIKSPE